MNRDITRVASEGEAIIGEVVGSTSPLPFMGGGQGEGEQLTLNLTATAKTLRTHSTDAERLLWSRIRAKQLAGFKFRRQEQIGCFIVDFVCYERQLVIEADGGQHAVEREKDEARTFWLNSQGFTVLRFWNHEILSNIEGVLETILEHLTEKPPLSSPAQ